MTEIPMPEVLDPARIEPSGGPDDDSGAHHGRVADAFYEACAYGQALWRELEQTRHYLLERVARGQQDAGPVVAGQGSLLRNQRDWEVWSARYGSVFSALW
jgi:hypothetical protein